MVSWDSFLTFLQTATSLAGAAFGIGFIIAFHELGHFLFARLFNIHVGQFSIGFGPKVWSTMIGATEFSISAVPLGGYVDLSEVDSLPDHTKFTIKPWYQKMLVMAGGIGFNVLLAFIIFWLVFLTGAPKTSIMFPFNTNTAIRSVAEKSAAEEAGLRPEDIIISVNGVSVVNDMAALVHELNKARHQAATLDILRTVDNQSQEHTLTMAVGDKSQTGKTIDLLGMGFTLQELPGQSLGASFISAIRLTWMHVKSTFYAYTHIRGISQLGGPIMVARETMNASYKGLTIFFLVLALISISLAILNLFPLPILDGGQMVFYTIEAIINRPLSEHAMNTIRIINWLLFLGLAIILSANDIYRIISPYIGQITASLGFGS